MAPPADLRAWIALLEREGELVRIEAEVDPELEITEITDRTVKAGGPALLFENVKGSSRPLLINQFGTERRMCLAFDAPSLDSVAEKLSDVLEMQPPAGLVDKVRGLQKLKSIADSRPKTVRRGAVAGGRTRGRRCVARPPSDPDLLARRRRAVHHPARRDHEGSAYRDAQRRDVPDAEARPARDGDALADPQGRPRGLSRHRRADRGRRRARPRPRHGVQRERTAAEAHRRADACRLPARRARRARAGEDRRPRGAGECGDRPRGLHRQGRADRRGAVRRPHRATTPRRSRSPSSG